MIIESSRNPMAAAVEKEAGWMLLSSLLACMPKEVHNLRIKFLIFFLYGLLHSKEFQNAVSVKQKIFNLTRS
ncbi:hypothetical protein P3L10_004282 [Capsicum annuum]